MRAREALNEQIAMYRRMSPGQRLAIALDLHETACDVARAGIRRQRPSAGPEEVEEELRRRLRLTHSR